MLQPELQSAAGDPQVRSGGGRQRQADPWRLAMPPFALLIACLVILYRDTLSSMVTIWYRSETFTHGFVVLPISLWLVWRKRAALVLSRPRPCNPVLVVVAGLAFAWLLGDLVAVNSITQLALVAMIVCAVPAVLGFSVTGAIAFPLVFLFFAVPIGEFIMPQLMDWTAEFTILALRMSGIPVFREGLNFVIPTGSWSVVEACSGVRYLIASLCVGTLYAYLNYRSLHRRLIFILVSILVPIVANWARAYIIVMLGHLSGNTIAVGVDHLIYGWVFFGIVILLMFLIGARWSEPEVAAPIQAAGSLMNAKAPAAGTFWITALVFAGIVSLPVLAKHAFDAKAVGDTPQLVLPDTAMGPWRAGEANALGFKPTFENPSAELNRVYVDGDHSVGVYIGYYRNQGYDRKLVTSTNVIVRSSDKAWSQLSQGTMPAVFGGQTRDVRFAELRRLGGAPAQAPEKLLVWQIYWIQGQWTSNDYVAKAYSALYRLLGRGDDSAVLVLYAPLQRAEDARASLAAFLSAGFGTVEKALQGAAREGHR